MVFSSGVGRRDELHTYGFGLLREIVKDPLAIPLLEVVLPPVGVFLPVGEHGVDQSGQLVGACPCAPQPSDRSRWSIGRLRSYPVKDGLRCGEWIQPSKLCVSNQPQATFDFSSSAVQRLPSVAPGSWVHSAWYEAVIGSPSSTAASMTGIKKAAVIQCGRPLVAPPARGRMSAARRVELTLPTQSSQCLHEKADTNV